MKTCPCDKPGVIIHVEEPLRSVKICTHQHVGGDVAVQVYVTCLYKSFHGKKKQNACTHMHVVLISLAQGFFPLHWGGNLPAHHRDRGRKRLSEASCVQRRPSPSSCAWISYIRLKKGTRCPQAKISSQLPESQPSSLQRSSSELIPDRIVSLEEMCLLAASSSVATQLRVCRIPKTLSPTFWNLRFGHFFPMFDLDVDVKAPKKRAWSLSWEIYSNSPLFGWSGASF